MSSKKSRARRPQRGEASTHTPQPARNRRGRKSGGSGPGFLSSVSGQLTVVVVLVVVGVLVLGIFQSIRSGGASGDFEFTLYQGQDELGTDDLRFSSVLAQGKPVVLNFWAGNCPPCRAELPAFQQAYEDYSGEVIFFGLDVGPFTGLGTISQGRALLRELGITYPAGTPPNGVAVQSYQVLAMPTTVFFTADGKQFDRSSGALSKAQLDRILANLVAAS
ncbi:MAG: TlpA family protein disulfide reductase [Chloroflexi bacterium]|nr:TlpA family protein disulfide reductase [Chloroflexota bacterium]